MDGADELKRAGGEGADGGEEAELSAKEEAAAEAAEEKEEAAEEAAALPKTAEEEAAEAAKGMPCPPASSRRCAGRPFWHHADCGISLRVVLDCGIAVGFNCCCGTPQKSC